MNYFAAVETLTCHGDHIVACDRGVYGWRRCAAPAATGRSRPDFAEIVIVGL
jgi:hypothetical protein